MTRRGLALSLLLLAPSSVSAQNARAYREASYRTTISSCKHGQAKTSTGVGVLVLFNDEATRSRTPLARNAADVVRPPISIGRSDAGTSLQNVVPAMLTKATVDDLLGDSNVAGIEADCIVLLEPEKTTDSGTRIDRVTWGLDRVDQRDLPLNSVYDFGAMDGAAARVYILDTGVRTDHSDFGGRAIAGWSWGDHCSGYTGCRGVTWVENGVITEATKTCHYHGTHCASTAGGTQWGVAKGTTIITVQVLSCEGSGLLSGVLAGIQWAVDDAAMHPGAKSVISMSLGGGYSSAENRAVKAAHDAGVLVVVAAGNDNEDACGYSPASATEAITVGSTASSDMKSYFSNWGSCVDIRATHSTQRSQCFDPVPSAPLRSRCTVRGATGRHPGARLGDHRRLDDDHHLDEDDLGNLDGLPARRRRRGPRPLQEPELVARAGRRRSHHAPTTECAHRSHWSAFRTLHSAPRQTPPHCARAAQVTDYIKCLGTEGKISNLPSGTVNKLLYTGKVVDEVGGDCKFAPFPPASPSPPPRPPPVAGVCRNTCTPYIRDGDCDDGGPGAEWALCAIGTDTCRNQALCARP